MVSTLREHFELGATVPDKSDRFDRNWVVEIEFVCTFGVGSVSTRGSSVRSHRKSSAKRRYET